jgi:hypothetical protein
MNERIRLLAEQAKQYAEDEQNNPLKIYTLDCFNEKFAELIVKECMLLVEGYTLLDWEDSADKVIKEHFGVE